MQFRIQWKSCRYVDVWNDEGSKPERPSTGGGGRGGSEDWEMENGNEHKYYYSSPSISLLFSLVLCPKVDFICFSLHPPGFMLGTEQRYYDEPSGGLLKHWCLSQTAKFRFNSFISLKPNMKFIFNLGFPPK